MKVPFQVAPGTVSDETTFATPGVWADSNNARYWKGLPEPIGGWDELSPATLTGMCRNTYSWRDNRGVEFIAFGTNSKLMVYTEGQLYDITPVGLPEGFIDTADRADVAGWGQGGWGVGPWGGGPLVATYPRTWSLQSFGEWLLASPRGKGLYVWKLDTSAPAEIVPEAPTSMTCMLVTPERQVLALGCHEEASGQFNPMAVRGCASEDIHDWTTAIGNNAFENILEGGGNIISAALMGSGGGVAIWTESTLHNGRYLGYSDQTYDFDVIASDVGLAAPNAHTVVGATAFWLASNLQFYAWGVGGLPVMVPCPIRSDFADNVDSWEIDKVVSTPVSKFGEIWWFYPDNRDGDECSRYVALNVTDGTWFRGQLARSAVTDRPADYPLFVDPDGQPWEHEKGVIPSAWFAKSSGQYLSEGERRIMLRTLWPDFKGQTGPLEITFTTQDYPQSVERVKGPYTIAAGREKRDIRVEGRIIAMEIAGDGVFARLGKPELDVVSTGGR